MEKGSRNTKTHVPLRRKRSGVDFQPKSRIGQQLRNITQRRAPQISRVRWDLAIALVECVFRNEPESCTWRKVKISERRWKDLLPSWESLSDLLSQSNIYPRIHANHQHQPRIWFPELISDPVYQRWKGRIWPFSVHLEAGLISPTQSSLDEERLWNRYRQQLILQLFEQVESNIQNVSRSKISRRDLKNLDLLSEDRVLV